MGMKCIRCGTDNNLRDRTNNQGRCKNCNHPFAFEPSTVTDTRFKFTDPFFVKAIDDISAGGTLFFTPKQFLYFLDKRLQAKSSFSVFSLYFLFIFFNIFFPAFLGNLLYPAIGKSAFIMISIIVSLAFVIIGFRSRQNGTLSYQKRQRFTRFLQVIGGLIIGGGIWSSLANNSYVIFVISVLLGMLSIYLGSRPLKNQASTFLINTNQLQSWINRWQEINNTISEMLPDARQSLAPTSINPDLSAYSFDRAVICDTPEIAQLLIANNFHFENNCAVLSVTGYPQSIFSTVLEMLNRNPELKVYALHNATPRGVGLVHHLRTSPNWFPNGNAIIYDLGLLPRQIFSTRNIFIRNSAESAQEAKEMPQEVKQSLSKDELTWLESGNFVELESFSPQKIIQVLTQGIVQSQDPNVSDGLVLIDGGGYGGTGFIYSSESFG